MGILSLEGHVEKQVAAEPGDEVNGGNREAVDGILLADNVPAGRQAEARLVPSATGSPALSAVSHACGCVKESPRSQTTRAMRSGTAGAHLEHGDVPGGDLCERLILALPDHAVFADAVHGPFDHLRQHRHRNRLAAVVELVDDAIGKVAGPLLPWPPGDGEEEPVPAAAHRDSHRAGHQAHCQRLLNASLSASTLVAVAWKFSMPYRAM